MADWIDLLDRFYAPQALLVVSGILVLIDYYFPTDWPCHLGYVCFAAAWFFLLPCALADKAIGAMLVWGILALLHQFWFTHFLTNAPGVGVSDRTAPPAGEGPSSAD